MIRSCVCLERRGEDVYVLGLRASHEHLTEFLAGKRLCIFFHMYKANQRKEI